MPRQRLYFTKEAQREANRRKARNHYQRNKEAICERRRLAKIAAAQAQDSSVPSSITRDSRVVQSAGDIIVAETDINIAGTSANIPSDSISRVSSSSDTSGFISTQAEVWSLRTTMDEHCTTQRVSERLRQKRSTQRTTKFDAILKAEREGGMVSFDNRQEVAYDERLVTEKDEEEPRV
ncbi:hypothetical protein VNI00_011274 [Paramarasmius palmivorus]|uniref:BZIP domain-containing protein n=1 Tax=Paramarasmius palmivorus TaxID=297713 RepID=A0AAW0CD25_9AGAR